MIKDFKKTILYCCPVCGKIKSFNIDIFMFSGRKSVVQSCDCKNTFLLITAEKRGNFSINAPCFACNESHRYEISAKTLWNGEIVCFACPYLDFESFYVGSAAAVEHNEPIYRQQLSELIDQIGYNDYFVANPIVSDVSDTVTRLIKRGHVRCECGGTKMAKQVYYDRVELFCASCFSMKTLDAVCADDARTVARLKNIEINTLGGTSTKQ